MKKQNIVGFKNKENINIEIILRLACLYEVK